MKKISFLFLYLSISGMIQALSVVSAAGGLSTAITDSGGVLSTVESITVTGSIDARDFITMRDYMPKLAVIDLSGAKIAAYTGTGGTASTSSTVYLINKIPKLAFCFYNTDYYDWEGKCSLISVILPTSLTSIGESAFENCTGLTSITMPSSVSTIGEFAFYNCSSLTSITIPTSVTSISNFTFSGCTGLNSITIPASVTSIYQGAFQYCSNTVSVYIPSSVRSIGSQAFYGCSGFITVEANNPNYSSIDGVLFNKDNSKLIQCPTSKTGSYIIPSTVTWIGDKAFGDCSWLTSITIPSSVLGIGMFPFNNNNSALIIVDETNPNYSSIDGVLFNKDQTQLIKYSTSKTGSYIIPSTVKMIEIGAFYECVALTSVTIPSSVNSINSQAFRYCSGLTSVIIPSSVTYIGSRVFQNCSGLTSVTISSSITSLNDYAFSDCTGLTTFVIPASVTSIKDFALAWCSGMKSIYVYSTTPVILSSDAGSNAFYGIDHTSCVLHVPIGYKGVYQSAVEWQKFKIIVADVSITGVNNEIEKKAIASQHNGQIMLTNVPLNEILNVYNVQGVLVYSQQIKASGITFNLPAHGIYILRLGSQSMKISY